MTTWRGRRGRGQGGEDWPRIRLQSHLEGSVDHQRHVSPQPSVSRLALLPPHWEQWPAGPVPLVHHQRLDIAPEHVIEEAQVAALTGQGGAQHGAAQAGLLVLPVRGLDVHVVTGGGSTRVVHARSRGGAGGAAAVSRPIEVIVTVLQPSAEVLLEVAATRIGRATAASLIGAVSTVVVEVAQEVRIDASPIGAAE